MEQQGLVIKEIGDYVEILVMREAACGSGCDSCNSKCSEAKPLIVKTINTIELKIGEKVRIEMNSKSVLQYFLVVYGIPLVLLLTGIVFGVSLFQKYQIDQAELYGLIFGIVFMCLSYLIIKNIDKKHGEQKLKEVTIKRY